ncbi:MAG: hypothetical protein H0T89_00375 [Deltaproteobacteria bacterium]|nr:hypothetical protein [Deltaproteobacteria bacterium]MDQ3299770.1 hypothetical protein [Myxococcota bacterium]
MSNRERKPLTTMRPPTRRAFVAMIGAAAAAIAVREHTTPTPIDPPQRPWTGSTRWIGHC